MEIGILVRTCVMTIAVVCLCGMSGKIKMANGICFVGSLVRLGCKR